MIDINLILSIEIIKNHSEEKEVLYIKGENHSDNMYKFNDAVDKILNLN